MSAIQMIGTQRSGSNLLRVMLHQLGISAPHPPHIIERFIPILPMYGDLSIPDNFFRLVEDVCQLVESNPVSWGNVYLDRALIISKCRHFELVEIMRVIYELKCEMEKSNLWMCKSMANIHYISELEKYIKPYYLFLFRDGRDVALSFKNAIVGEKHVYFLAKQWQYEQELSIALYEQLGSKRVIMVKYEDLIAEPKKQLENICLFLGIHYESNAMEYYTSEESKETAHAGKMWENVDKPLIHNNFNKYTRGLSSNEIEIFERVAGRTLIKLGYEVENSQSVENTVFLKSEIECFSKENYKRKENAKLQQSREDIERRRCQNILLERLTLQFRNFLDNQNVYYGI
ncbi:MAG: sulfotransferase [Chitinophagaceae bacterium]